MKKNQFNIFLVPLLTVLCSSVANAQSNNDKSEAEESTQIEVKTTSTQSAEKLLLDYELERTRTYNNGYKSIDNTTQTNLTVIAAELKANIPESYESLYTQYKQKGYTEAGLELLTAAEKNTANKTELFSDFIACAHILKKTELFDEYTELLRSSGFISAEVLEYNKNVLRSVKTNTGFIITNGWSDTYPLLTLLKQEGKAQLEIINTEWLIDEKYRKTVATRLQVTNTSFNNNPYEWIYRASLDTPFPVYYTPTLPSSALIKAQESLTPIGLLLSLKPLSLEEQKNNCLSSWKKFSKLELITSNPLSKNYILLLNILETILKNDPSEQGTYRQVAEYKAQLIQQFPELN